MLASLMRRFRWRTIDFLAATSSLLLAGIDWDLHTVLFPVLLVLLWGNGRRRHAEVKTVSAFHDELALFDRQSQKEHSQQHSKIPW